MVLLIALICTFNGLGIMVRFCSLGTLTYDLCVLFCLFGGCGCLILMFIRF